MRPTDSPAIGRSHPPQHLPHPRKGGREGLFRARPHAADQGRRGGARAHRDHRGHRLRRPGGGRGDRAPAPARSIWSSARSPITACRSCSPRRGWPARSSPRISPSRRSSRRWIGRPRRRGPGTDDRAAVAAFLTVQEGCDKFCTFCVVPYTRGAEVSRPVEQIVAEATRLAGEGVRELTLLGQNVNAWHGDGPDGRAWGLGRLLSRLAEIPGIDRLRYTTSHPRDMDDELIAAHRDLDALMPYLHLPVQSGSDRVLAAMNRRHTRADYLRLDRPDPRGATRHRARRRFHRRLPRRDRCRFRRHAAPRRRGRLRGRLLLQVQPAAGHAGGRRPTTRSPRR